MSRSHVSTMDGKFSIDDMKVSAADPAHRNVNQNLV
jgi:hypothetical protein